MPDLDLPQRQATDTLMLTGFWYRALPADRVHRNQLHKATLLEIPLVIGRDRIGKPFALRDACPHRGMPLNCGRFDGENLECGYHGWQFDVHDGQCQLIPSLTADQNLKVDRIYAGSYPCQEQDNFIWVYIPDVPPPGAGFAPPAQPSDEGEARHNSGAIPGHEPSRSPCTLPPALLGCRAFAPALASPWTRWSPADRGTGCPRAGLTRWVINGHAR